MPRHFTACLAVPTWRYIANGSLRSHSVPAVDEFKKILAEAEKAVSKKT